MKRAIVTGAFIAAMMLLAVKAVAQQSVVDMVNKYGTFGILERKDYENDTLRDKEDNVGTNRRKRVLTPSLEVEVW